MHPFIRETFGDPTYFEPDDFRRLGEQVSTLRFLPAGRDKRYVIHTSTRADDLFEPHERGQLLIDQRLHSSPYNPIATALFNVNGSTLEFDYTYVEPEYHNMGLIAYLALAAQNVTGWLYPLSNTASVEHW